MSIKSTRTPCVGDIWLVSYPYLTPGNMEKTRPAIILGFKGYNQVILRKLTTKKKYNYKEFSHPKLKRRTFLSNEVITVDDYRLIRYIGKIK